MTLHSITREPLRGSADTAPVLVLLHGVRSNEHDLMGLAPVLDERFRIFSVRAPLTLGAGAYGWYNVEFRPDGFLLNEEEAKDGLNKLLAFLDGIAGPVYLMGFSQGAIMSVAAALTVPEKVEAVVAMSGRLLESLVADRAEDERLRGLPVTVVHGTEDSVIPIGMGRAMRDYLAALPVDLTYREYDMGHHLSQESMRDIQAFLQTRLASPGWRNRSA
jgi:phospholipase/carboxylesterase